MRKAIGMAAIALAVSTAHTAFAQRRPATEADALSYIYSAFLTQADPGVMGRQVVLGPELQRALNLPPSTDGAKVYDVLIGFAGQKHPEVRKATPQEVAEYGARRGFDRTSGALYTVEVGERKFLMQYDLQRINVSFVGQLGLPDPDPRPVAVKLDPAPMKAEPPAKAEPIALSALQWSAQFPFNSAELSAEMRAALDDEILPKLANGAIRVHISGHADRIGNPAYNQKLSERRADALRAYLVEKGVEESKIEIFSYGTTLPAKDCGAEKGRALIECLAPNRRVVLEVTAR
jgi:outer membrane protein OmpA-like peptidoglycan-associated protein